MKLFSQFLSLLILTFFSTNAFSQSVVGELDNTGSVESFAEPLEEKVIKVSPSKKIFLLSNQNSNLQPGDYISLLLNEEIFARALVAKTHENFAGIKIIKIYSPAHWERVRPKMDLQVLKGDDSYFLRDKEGKGLKKDHQGSDSDLTSETDTEADGKSASILTEDDLFSKEDEKFDEEKNFRSIKPDNVISMSYGQAPSLDANGQKKRYPHMSAQWAYQVADNIWGEFILGQSTLKDYPNSTLDTTITTIALRVKYAIAVPFSTYLKPYMGFQMVDPSSSAGKPSGSQYTQEELNKEKEMVDVLKKNSLIFGLTVLKRLVPGWFLKAEIGSDLMNIGIGFEF